MTTRIKLRRDTASNWMDHNPVLALAEPGVETDTNKMKIGDGATAWNKLQYSDGADVTRIKAGFITSVGNIPELGNGEGDDFWFESVTVDSDMNSYYVGGNYDYDYPWAVKLNPMGEVEWQTILTPFDGYGGEGQAIQIDPTNGDLVIVADMNSSGNVGGNWGMLMYRLDPSNGTLIGNPTRLRDDISDNSVDIYPYDIQMDGDKAVIFGKRHGDIWSSEVSKQTGSNGQDIIILTNILETGAYPRPYNDWYITGTDVNGNGLVTAVNNYTNIASTGGNGNGAYFNISYYVRANTPITSSSIADGGSGYAVNDVLTLTAADAGASENVTITVTGIGGAGDVSAFVLTSYSPDLTKIKLTIDPNGGGVNFSNSGTWDLKQYKGNSGFIYSEQGSGWTASVGDSDNDRFLVGGIDSNGNVYAGGITYDDLYLGGSSRNMLVKFDNTGAVQYKKSFDFIGSEGPDGYTGLAVDSMDNVYIAGYMFDYDNTGYWYHTITKINSAGVRQWQKAFNSGSDPYQMWNMCIDVDSDDNVYLAAEFSSPDSQDDDFFFAKFDSSGNNIWQRMLSSYGDANAEWSNGYQSLKVQGDKLFYAASTLTYSNNDNFTALAFSINTDGTGVGTIANSTWQWKEVSLNWADTPSQRTQDVQVGVGTATFTTDEPVTGTDNTTYGVLKLDVYDGMGGNVNGVRTITFEDGTVQTTASKPIIAPIIDGTQHGSYDLWLRLDHAGQFIRVNFYNGNQRIYVPMNDDVPFEVGTVISIIADDINTNGNRIEIRADNNSVTQITGVGYSSDDNPSWWELNNTTNNNKTGIYTLMKIDIDRWVIAGPDVQENWC